MRFRALATDYDGTLAEHGAVSTATIDALRRCRESGRQILLVTGRELTELVALCPCLDLFDLVVVENGATLYWPQSATEKSLAEPPSAEFVDLLLRRKVPLSVGRTIVATIEPYESIVLRAIHELGLELQVIFNKGSVMVLPSGVNKASGLKIALKELGLSRRNVVAVGDGENDHSLLAFVEAGVAVASAVPFLRERADYVTSGAASIGVIELIDLLHQDLEPILPALRRNRIPLGRTQHDVTMSLSPYGSNVLIVGGDDGGARAFKDRLIYEFTKCDRQYCRIGVDPASNLSQVDTLTYSGNDGALQNILAHFQHPVRSLAVCIDAPSETSRRDALFLVWGELERFRMATSRPHWIIIDQADWLFDPNRELPYWLAPDQWRNVVVSTSAFPTDVSDMMRFSAITTPTEDAAQFEKIGLPVRPPLNGNATVLCWLKEVGAAKPLVVRPVDASHDRAPG